MFENLKTDDNIQEDQDRLGGGMPDGGIYDGAVDLAYLDESAGGAMSVVLRVVTPQKQTFRSTMWITSGTKKGKKNYYEDQQGNKHYLPGFNMANALSILTTGKELAETAGTTETKLVPVWNSEAKKELPTEKQVMTALLGAKIKIGVIREKVNKQAKGDDGKYHPTAETREQLVIDRIFHPDTSCTLMEKKAGKEKGEFIEQWGAKYTGIVVDNTVAVDSVATSNAQADGGNSATKPLF